MLFVFQGTENTLDLSMDQKMLLRSSVSIRAALLKELSFGMGICSRMSPNAAMATEAVHTVLAAHLPARGGSW